jgi:hypothetical protein
LGVKPRTIDHVLEHGLHPAASASAFIVSAKILGFDLEGFVDETVFRSATLSALDNRFDPPFASVDTLDALLDRDGELFHAPVDAGLELDDLAGHELPELVELVPPVPALGVVSSVGELELVGRWRSPAVIACL